MTNLIKTSALLLTLLTVSACGVEIHNDSGTTHTSSDEYVRYTVSEADRWGDTVKELSTNCINLYDEDDYGDIRIEDSRIDDAITFSWDNSYDDITFRLSHDGDTLNKSTFDHDYFQWNNVEQDVNVDRIYYKLEVEKDSFCS